MASGQKVNFPSANKKGNGDGVVFGDPASGKPGLIVIHEWWGRNEQILTQGECIANEGGFVVLVPDMYRGKVAIDNEEAGHLMGGLDWEGAVQDLDGAAKYLLQNGCKKVGVTGFCMGGALSLCAAVKIPGSIRAAAPFYGMGYAHGVDFTQIKIPVQGHFGEHDDLKGFSAKSDIEPLYEKLKPSGLFELIFYDAGHAFANPNHKNYNPEATKKATKSMYEFMHKHLDN